MTKWNQGYRGNTVSFFNLIEYLCCQSDIRKLLCYLLINSCYCNLIWLNRCFIRTNERALVKGLAFYINLGIFNRINNKMYKKGLVIQDLFFLFKISTSSISIFFFINIKMIYRATFVIVV